MIERDGFRRSGCFTIGSGVELPGELHLNGAKTTLNLYSDQFFNTTRTADITGVFHDRSKVSLVDCIPTSGPGHCTRGDERYHFSSVFPHFVVFGDQHISSSTSTIREVSFTVDDAPVLFYDYRAFGTVIDPNPHMQRIAEAEGQSSEIEIGEFPHIFYFSGKAEIFAAETVLGRVSATHGLSYRLPGPEGIRADNTIRINLRFQSARTVDEAVGSVLDVLRFLEVIAGRPQNVSELRFLRTSSSDRPEILEVYWCMPPRRDSSWEVKKPHPADLPMQAAKEPDVFAEVLTAWLERQQDCRTARARFSTAFSHGYNYTIDRLVGAANMFDILPASACQEVVDLSSDLQNACEIARKEFKALPASPERDSVLGALGRLGKFTLKRKVRSRVRLVTDIVGANFPDIERVVDEAVNCRNYFVHGSVAKINYGDHQDQLQFFTDTLEFVFAASDLVESGWNMAEWTGRASVSHPFGSYLRNYAVQLRELQKLL